MKKLLAPIVAMIVLAVMFKMSMPSMNSSNSSKQKIVKEVVVDNSMSTVTITNLDKAKEAMGVLQAP